MPFQTIGSPLLWAGFIVFVLAMLAIDLGVFHRKAHEVSLREAGIWSAGALDRRLVDQAPEALAIRTPAPAPTLRSAWVNVCLVRRQCGTRSAS